MVNALSVKAVFKSSLHPVAPLFMGSWNTKSSSKWRGIASELTYNSYLRNGWVTIDTGVKGSAGTPLIEFSCWEFGESRYSISLPNIMSFKFFLQKGAWGSRFITRTSVVAQEAWFDEFSSYANSINTYAVGSTLRKSDKLVAFFFSITYLRQRFSLLTGGFTALARLCLKDNAAAASELFLYRRGIMYSWRFALYKRNRLFFAVSDKESLNLTLSYTNTLTFLWFNNFFFGSFKKKLLNHKLSFSQGQLTSKFDYLTFSGSSLEGTLSFFEVLRRLNTFVLYVLEVQGFRVINSFFSRVLKGILIDFFSIFGISAFGRLSFFVKSGTRANFAVVYIEVLVKQLIVFLGVARLTPLNTLKLVLNFLMNAVEKFKSFIFSCVNGRAAMNITQFFSYKLTTYSAVSLFSIGTFFESTVLPAMSELPFDSFLTSYTRVKKRRRFKAFLGLKVRRKYKPWLRYKRKRIKRVALNSYPLKVFWKPWRSSWRKLVSYLKFSAERKQFMFLYFWSINFFNFWVSKVTFGSFFYGAVRLMFFFRNFFKFYNFYVNLLKFITTVSSRNLARIGTLFINLKVYLFALHVKFSRTLIAFYSLCNKLFQRRWVDISNRSSFMAVTAIKRLSLLASKSTVDLPLIVDGLPNFWNSLFYLTRAYVWANRSLNFGSEVGYSRAYLQFLVELRNKSLKTWLNYFRASINTSLFKTKGSFGSDVLTFFSKFKSLLNQLGQAISVNLFKKRVKLFRFMWVKKKLFSILSGFVYGCRSLMFTDYSLGKTFIKKFVTVVVNLMYMKKNTNAGLSRKFKKIISFMLMFTGFREDLLEGILMKKYLLTFFYWVKKLVFCVNKKHFAYSKAFLKHSLGRGRSGFNNRKLTEFDFFSSALKRGNRGCARYIHKNNLSRLTYLRTVHRLVKNAVGGVQLHCLRSFMRVLYAKRRLVLMKNNLVCANNVSFLVSSRPLYSNFLNLPVLFVFSMLQNFSFRFPTLVGVGSSYLSTSSNEFFNTLKSFRIMFQRPFGFGRTLTASVALSRGFSYSFFLPVKSFSFFMGRNILHFCLNKTFLFDSSYRFLGLKSGKDCTVAFDISINTAVTGENFLSFVETAFVRRAEYLRVAGGSTSLFAVVGWLALRSDFLSILTKKIVSALLVAVRNVTSAISYFVSARVRFLRNLSCISRYSSWVVYKYFFFLKADRSTHVVKFSGVSLARLFSLSTTTSSFRKMVFSAVRVFVRLVSAKSLVGLTTAVAAISRPLSILPKNTVPETLCFRVDLSSSFFRVFAHTYYFKSILAWFTFLSLRLRDGRGFTRGWKNRLSVGARPINSRPLCVLNRFYCGNLRRLRKAAVSIFFHLKPVLSFVKIIAVCEYAAKWHDLMAARLNFLSSSIVSLVKRGSLRLKFLSNLKKIKLVGSLVIADSVSRVCRLNYFVKFSTYLLNSSSVTSLIFNGIFYHWFAPVCVQFWNNARAVRKLKLLPNARKVGLFPRLRRTMPFHRKNRGGFFKKTFDVSRKPLRRKDMKIFYYDGWQKVSNANFKNKLMPSMFSRENFLSMQLAYETVKPKFRFINLKGLRVIKRAKRRLLKFVVRSKIGLFRKRRRFKFFRRFFRRLFRRKRFNLFKKRPFYRRRIRIKLRRIIQKFFIKAFLKLTFIGRRHLFVGGTKYLASVVGFLNSSLVSTYNAQLLYSHLVGRYFSILYSRLVGWRVTSRLEFFKNSKLRFLFILMKSFFNKTFVHLTNFIYFFNFNSLVTFSLQQIFNQFGAEFIRLLPFKSGVYFNLELQENLLRYSYASVKRAVLVEVNTISSLFTSSIFWGVLRTFFISNKNFFNKLNFLSNVNSEITSVQFFFWRKPLYNYNTNARRYLLVLDRRTFSHDFVRVNRLLNSWGRAETLIRGPKVKFVELATLLSSGVNYTGRVSNALMTGKYKYLKFWKFQGISDGGYGYLLKKFFLFKLAKYREEQKVAARESGFGKDFKFRRFNRK